jgi:hypothetical protein
MQINFSAGSRLGWISFSPAAQRAAGMNRLCPTFLLALQKEPALFP